MEDFGTLLNTFEARLSTFEHIEILLNIFENHLPYLHHLGRVTDRQYMAWGTFRMQEMSQIHPFHLLLQLFGANDLFFVHFFSPFTNLLVDFF